MSDFTFQNSQAIPTPMQTDPPQPTLAQILAEIRFLSTNFQNFHRDFQIQLIEVCKRLDQLENTQKEFALNLEDFKQRETQETSQNTSTHHDSKENSKENSKEKLICVWRNISASGNFPSFEDELENRLNERFADTHHKKPRSWFSTQKSGGTVVRVKLCKSLEMIPASADLVLLCCYSSSVRIDASDIVPCYNVLSSTRGLKVACIAFRYGESSTAAKIVRDDDHQGKEEIIPSFPVQFSSAGIIASEMTKTSIEKLAQMIQEGTN